MTDIHSAGWSQSVFNRQVTIRRGRAASAGTAGEKAMTPAKRLRIGITTSVIQRGKTGVAQYVFALVRALMEVAEDHEFVLFVLEEDVPLFQFATPRMQLYVVPEKWRSAVKNIFWHQAVLPSIAKELGLDVLHVPSYRRMLWRKPCALVATIHDLAPFHIQEKYDPLRMFYGRVVVKRLAQRQDAILAISTNTARDIREFFHIPLGQQNVILNGLDHERFCPSADGANPAAKRTRWNLEHPFFLYVSRLEHPAKNHVRLIDAFNAFKAATGSPWLLALGGSDWHGADVIRRKAAESPFAADIRFLGFVPDADLPDLYRAAGAFVYPSLFEGFGLPPVEAMACGCPVISSTRGALREVVGRAALAVNPEDVADMTAALTTVSSDEAKRDALIEAGFCNAARFDWKANARAVMAVYQSAAATLNPQR